MLPSIRGVTIVAASFLSVTPCFAHATLEVTQATPNSGYRGVVRIPHGCDGAATTAVRVTIPEGVIAAKPMPKPGWTLSTKTGAYAKTYDLFSHKVSEGVTEITWSNGNLPDAYYDEFVFSARFTSDLPVGKTVYFPVIQDCGAKSERWVGIPAAGQSPHSLPNAAPGVMMVAAKAGAARMGAMAMDKPATYRVGNLTVSTPWIRATPKGAPVAGGYLKITNNGAEPDRLVDGSLVGAGRFEIHEMTMDNGVMKMRPISGGLEIKPGQTVELSPGGYHIMFMEPKEQFRPGQTVKGTLEFAKAGKVDISYQVQPMGAGAPGMEMHHH
jgi:uncharacterized protein YcnI/copper(I)-binding protein